MLADLKWVTDLHRRASALDDEAFGHRAAGRHDEAITANIAARNYRDAAEAIEQARKLDSALPAAPIYPLSERGLPLAFRRDTRAECAMLVGSLLLALLSLVLFGGMG